MLQMVAASRQQFAPFIYANNTTFFLSRKVAMRLRPVVCAYVILSLLYEQNGKNPPSSPQFSCVDWTGVMSDVTYPNDSGSPAALQWFSNRCLKTHVDERNDFCWREKSSCASRRCRSTPVCRSALFIYPTSPCLTVGVF